MSDAHVNSENELTVETEDITAVEKDGKMTELADAELQKSHERPSTLEVEPVSECPAPAAAPAPALTPAGCLSRRDAQLTDRGYFDVKFYHNKLW